MLKQQLKIENIFAEEATAANYQVISFDLPEHGERKNKDTL